MIRLVNPAFAFGLLAALLPILVHLLLRDRIRRVAFSSLRFLRHAPKHVLRHKVVSESLLVLLRAAACVLAALVFCRPVFCPRGDPSALRVDRATVVVVDLSGSVPRSADAVRLREEVTAALDGLGRGDAAALMVFDRRPTVLVPMTTDLASLRTALDRVVPGHGGTDIAGALRRADDLLRDVSAPTRRVLLVTDLQRSGWRDFRGDWRLTPGVELAVHPLVPAAVAADLAIVRADYPRSAVRDATARTIAVRVANLGQEAAPDVPVVLTVNDREVNRQSVSIPPHGAVAVRFGFAFEQAGDNLGTVSVEQADLCPDNSRWYFNTKVIPRIPVLLIGTAEATPQRSADFLLRTALAPAPESPFEVRGVAAGRVSAQDVQAASVVILADVPALAPEVREAIDSLLRRGGGVLALPGAHAAPDSFVIPGAEDLSPCRLRRIVVNAGRGGQAREMGLARIDYTHPVFEAFLRPHHGDFSAVRYTRYWEVTGSQLSRVLARFEDGRPAVLEREVAAGVVMAWLAPPDPTWGNLPGRAIYLPLLHQTVRYLCLRTEPAAEFVVGDALPVSRDETVTLPDGTAVPGGNVAAPLPGFYRVEKPGTAPRHLTVNTPTAEAEVDTVSPDELRAALVTPVDAGAPAQAGTAPGSVVDRGLWQAVLLALLLVLLVESFVANRALRN